MKRSLLVLPLAAFAVVACSQQPASTDNADDFAARIGEGKHAEMTPTPTPPPVSATSRAHTAPPHGADVTQLEKLGEVADMDLGPRDGGCSFKVDNTEMLLAVALRDPAMGGKGVIRVGNGLVLLDSGPGGLSALEKGTVLTGTGVKVVVSPQATEDTAQPRSASVSVTGADGKTQTYSGKWICA